MTSVLVRVVRNEEGESGVSEMLARAAVPYDAPFLESLENWISLAEAEALLLAGVEVTGDPALPRRVGEEALRQHAGTQVATLLRSLGSPEAVLRQVTVAAAKFSTATQLEAAETESGHAVVRAQARSGFERSKALCEWTQGLLSQCGVLFGMPPARVRETECQAEGGQECRYEISWDQEAASAAADPEQRTRVLEAQVVALSQRLQSAFATARDLVSPDELDVVLARIVERAADAVRAPAYVLSVQLDDDRDKRVFSDGIGAEEAAALVAATESEAAAALLGATTDDLPHVAHTLCVAVSSSRRHYGHLIARYPDGESFFSQERQLLGLYAKHAAAVLDTAMALREAERRNEHVTRLLALSQAVAAAATTEQVAQRLTDAVVDFIGCDRASLWLWDPESGCLHRLWTAGGGGRLSQSTLSPRESSRVRQILTEPAPLFLNRGEERDPLLAKMMAEAGVAALAMTPVLAQGQLMAVLTAGALEDATRLRPSAQLQEKLRGVAALAAPALQNRQLIDELGHQVIHDGLTGILNRIGFLREMERVLLDGTTQGPAGLLFADIDGFKQLNDRYGHQVGDELLRQVAARLRDRIRAGDLVARLGGDEFAIFLPRAETAEEVSAVAQRVEDGFAASFQAGTEELQIRVSVGEAFAAEAGATIDDLVRMADAVMYERKAARRRGANGSAR